MNKKFELLFDDTIEVLELEKLDDWQRKIRANQPFYGETKIRIVTSLAMLDPKNQADFEEQLGKSLYEGMD